MKKLNSFKKIFIESNWVITLTATLLGVFLALYLNQLIDTKELKIQKSKVVSNIINELDNNYENLSESLEEYKGYLHVLTFLQQTFKNGEGITAPYDTLQYYISNYPHYFLDKDSIVVIENESEYVGSIHFKYKLAHVHISSIALETLKNSGISSSFDFDCLMKLEYIRKVAEEFTEQEKLIKKSVLESVPDMEFVFKDEKFKSELQILILFEEILLKTYKSSKEKIRINCG